MEGKKVEKIYRENRMRFKEKREKEKCYAGKSVLGGKENER